MKDPEIFNLIEAEHQRQLRGIELIASENFVSNEVMQAMGSWLTNKYAEGYPGHRYYGGCAIVDQTESIAIERAKKLFEAEYVNVQPHSGAQANAAVFLTCLNPGDTFMGLNLDHGGHLSHGSRVNTSGMLYNPIGYNLNKETGKVDYDEMAQLAQQHKPKLIIGGGSAYSREWDYARMREIADIVGDSCDETLKVINRIKVFPDLVSCDFVCIKCFDKLLALYYLCLFDKRLLNIGAKQSCSHSRACLIEYPKH